MKLFLKSGSPGYSVFNFFAVVFKGVFYGFIRVLDFLLNFFLNTVIFLWIFLGFIYELFCAFINRIKLFFK